MYHPGQKVMAYFEKASVWVSGTVEGRIVGWDGNFKRQYRVKLDVPFVDGDVDETHIELAETDIRIL